MTLDVKSKLAVLRWLVALLAVGLLLFELGGRALNEPDEGRYAGIGWEMRVRGQWLVPHLNGAPHLSKPPLTYWLIAGSMAVFGPNEFAARLPAALAGLGALFAVYLLARRTWNEGAALWTVAVLATSLLFFGGSRLITTDMVLTCCVTWSVWSFWRWHTGRQRDWWCIAPFFVWLALGFLTKGPVALLLPMFAVLGARWRQPTLRLRAMGWGRGTLLLLAIATPWFIALAVRNPQLWEYFLVRESLARFATTVHGRQEPWWYFIPVLAVGFLPWTGLLPSAAVALRQQAEPGRTAVRLLAAWAGLGLLLFTLSRSKLPTYVFPLLPPLAVLTGAALAQPTAGVGRHWRIAAMAVFALLAALVAVLGGVAIQRFGVQAQALLPVIALTVAGVTAGVLLLWRWRWHGAVVAAILTTALLEIGIVRLFPHIEQRLRSQVSAKFVAARLQQANPDGSRPLVAYHRLPRGLPFYLGRLVLCYQPPTHRNEPAVFEFGHNINAPNVISDPSIFQALLSNPAGTIVLATESELTSLQRDAPGLTAFARVGSWVLLSNGISAIQQSP